MANPFEQAGSVHEPTEYAPLTMDRYITGVWTQRSPMRDAAVPYIYGKFYGASRYDSLIDGKNREVTAKLTFKRRPGHTVFNSQTFPAILSFYSFKFIQNGVEVVRVMADTATAVYDATPPNTQTLLFTKSAGAGPTRFLGVGTQLFMSNGVDQKKWTQSNKTWQPHTAYSTGDFIVDPNGNIQLVRLGYAQTMNISSIQIVQSITAPITYLLIVTWASIPQPWAPNTSVKFAGLTTFTELNGQSLAIQTIDTQTLYGITPAANQTCFTYYHGPVVVTPDTGTGTGTQTNAGTTGAFQPSWSTGIGFGTFDGVQWTNMGPALQNWSLPAPTNAPTLVADPSDHFWRPWANVGLWYGILDSNENLEVTTANPGFGTVTGNNQPNWSPAQGGLTTDGGMQWTNCGDQGGQWAPSVVVQAFDAIVDSNNNLQIAWAVVAPGQTGTVTPTWATTLGANTVDNNVTWRCCGPGLVLVSGSISYAYSYHSIDGSVSTASPLVTIPNGVLGPTSGYKITLSGVAPTDPQCDQIWIWRTDQGGSTLVFRQAIPNQTVGTAGTWTWTDTDPTSGALNPLIIAPIAGATYAGDPPPSTATAPEYHLQRVWMIDGSVVRWSGGPNTVTGNGNTAFPPQNSIQMPEAITRLYSSVTNEAVLMVFGAANCYAILGDGTSVFYPVRYMKNVGLLNYNALDMVGSSFYLFTNNSKGAELDPGAGYVEYGFPIGDQFTQMSTAGISGSIYDPTKTYVTWHEKESGDTGLYVCDGAVGWWRYSPVAPPESGFLWSPFAAIVGGTSAVQSVEVAPGDFELLVGPATSGPILKRDPNVFTDNGATYGVGNCYGTIGNIVLCASGEVAEIAHVEMESIRVGDRPQAGLLYNEISETATIKFDILSYTSVDPPILQESQTLYSDRYTTLQDGVTPKCSSCQIKLVWPDQNVGDELLSHAIFGAKFAERRQQPG